MILHLFPAGIRGKGVHRLCQEGALGPPREPKRRGSGHLLGGEGPTEGALPGPVGPLNYPRPTTKT